MATKAAYDCNIGEALRAQLDAISLRVGVDSFIVPQMPPYHKQLSRTWEPEEPYDEDDEDEMSRGTRAGLTYPAYFLRH